jgi:hypothetical protein
LFAKKDGKCLLKMKNAVIEKTDTDWRQLQLWRRSALSELALLTLRRRTASGVLLPYCLGSLLAQTVNYYEYW